MRSLAALLISVALTACIPQGPGAPTPAPVTEVSASAAKTWDAVIDVFAERNIPIRNMERASGFISTDALAVSSRQATTWADCGTSMGVALAPDKATYNVLVRGDSSHANVKVTVRWTMGGGSAGMMGNVAPRECATKGVWEKDMQASVKARAEAGVAAK